MSVEVRQTSPGGSLKDFLGVVDSIYQGDPNYIRPLDFDQKSRFNRSHPFFEHGEAVYFTAYRNGRCVGRCSAQIDHAHLRCYRDATGFFGCFDTQDDSEVALALMNAARRWLKDRDMHRVRGPFSLSINEESGCLVKGFDTPPMVLMPHHRPYQGRLIEECGLAKVKDLYAWRYEIGHVSARVQKAHDEIELMPEVYSRQADPAELARDARLLVDIHNDAWSETWGFVPFSENEVKKFATDLKLLLDPALTCIAYVDGEPAAMALALPNLNEAVADLGGKLFPLGMAKLLYRLKVKGVSSARLPLLGITKKFRTQRKYAGLSLFLYAKLNAAARRRGYTWGELGWTLEDNGPVNAGIRTMGGKIYKTYRLYEASL